MFRWVKKQQQAKSHITQPTKVFAVIQYIMKPLVNRGRHGAARWAQSELFFRLLLKNTVWASLKAAYDNFLKETFKWRIPTISLNFYTTAKVRLLKWFLICKSCFITSKLPIVKRKHHNYKKKHNYKQKLYG